MRYGEQRWVDVEQINDRVAILPLGSLEQHGHHLPLSTDSRIGRALLNRAGAELNDEAVLLPMLQFGASDHHIGFPGTVSLSHDTYRRIVADILESLIAAGFSRMFVFNAHGGNELPARSALYDVRMRHRSRRDLWLVFGTWYRLAAPQIAALEPFRQDAVAHACEMETSVMLRLHPELVHLEEARGACVPFTSSFYHPDHRQPNRLDVYQPYDQISATGALLHPELASADKGERILEAVANEIVACVREISSWQPLSPA